MEGGRQSVSYSLLIQNRNSGKIYECASIAQTVVLSTKRTGAPASLKVDLLKCGGLAFWEGDPIRFEVDGTLVFYGYVFTKEQNRWGELSVTAYDQTRYLLAKQAYRFTGATAESIIRRAASAFRLTVGALENTGYTIPYLDFGSGKSCLDIIQSALQQVTVNTGKVFTFYDDCGKLALRESGKWRSEAVLGDGFLVTDYTYKTDIDSDTYNSVKLVRPNAKTGRGEVYSVKNNADIGKWGLLQYYAQVDEGLTDAQVKAQAKVLLSYYDRVLRTLSLECLGVVGLRAGQTAFINIRNLGDISLSRYVMLESVEHTFQNGKHTMRVETRALTEV